LIEDLTSIGRYVRSEGNAKTLTFLQNVVVAEDVVRRAIIRGRIPPRYVGWWTYLRGLNDDSDTGNIVLLTDLEGSGPQGFVRQPIYILVRKKSLGLGMVYLWGLDLGPIREGAAKWGSEPEDPDSPNAQWADVDGTIPPDGTRAFQWR